MNRKESVILASAFFGLILGIALDPLRQTWAHVRLAARLQHPLDASVSISGVPVIQGVGNIVCGKDVRLADELYLDTQQAGDISIGNHVVLSRGVRIVSASQVSIREGAMIGEYVQLSTLVPANELETVHSTVDATAITIGRNVWIGRNTVVLSGVSIGDDAIISPYTIVAHDVPPGAVVGGAPARLLHLKSNS
jgi:acetyltransferase-like isoleucine patch superfamily enzyme